MQQQIIQTLQDLRHYALGKSYEIELFYHEEDSYLMRFANSAISLNTNEHLIRLDITAYSGRQRASYALITDLDKVDERRWIDPQRQERQRQENKHGHPRQRQARKRKWVRNPFGLRA